MNNISITSSQLINALKADESKEFITQKWSNFAKDINDFDNYTDIPNAKEASEAMFLYTMKFKNHDEEEECIRSFIAFCLLKRATEETTGKDKIESFIRLTLLLSNKMFCLIRALHYTMPKHISDYNPSETPKLDSSKVALLQKNYNAIKVYIYNNVISELNKYSINQELIERFQNNTSSFIEKQSNNSYNLLELSNGEELLNSCYQRLLEFGKYPLSVKDKNGSAFYINSNGLIRNDFKFQAKTYIFTHSGMQYNESPTSASFLIKLNNEKIKISTRGIKEEFIYPFLSLPINHVSVTRLSRRTEMLLKVNRESSTDNIPMSLDIVTDKDKVIELQFFFITGEHGVPRYINFYGESVWLDGNKKSNNLFDDFNFNLDHIIPYDIKEKYLPVRAMTADNMGQLGDVAIIGCNPVKYDKALSESYSISENDETEYFVFPKWSPLYNELVDCLQTMKSWNPDTIDYHTIHGWIFGELKIVHISTLLL